MGQAKQSVAKPRREILKAGMKKKKINLFYSAMTKEVLV